AERRLDGVVLRKQSREVADALPPRRDVGEHACKRRRIPAVAVRLAVLPEIGEAVSERDKFVADRTRAVQRRAQYRGAERADLLRGVDRHQPFLGVDRERLLGGLGLLDRFFGRRRLLLDLFPLFLEVLFAGAVAEERAADVRALLRLSRAVMARERDPARVLGALRYLADRDAGVLRIGAHDRRDVLVASPEEIDEPPPDLGLEEPDELAVARMEREQAFLLAELALRAGAVFREDVLRGGVDHAEDPGLAHVL